MEYSVDALFNDWSNYKSEKFILGRPEDMIKFLKLLNGNLRNITTKCMICNKEYAFNMRHEGNRFKIKLRPATTINELHFDQFIDFKPQFKTYYISYNFMCTKDDTHIYKMYIIVIQRKNIFEVIKIGQFPNK